MDERVLKKLYIEETLKTRKYIGYRLDIALIKIIITGIVFVVSYFYSKDMAFSIIVASQVFLILTLFNKVKINRKIKVGKGKLLQRIKLKRFKNKIYYSDYNNIENFIMLYLNQYRYKDIKRLKKYRYSAIKDNEEVAIYIMKFCEDSIIEKLDIRNLLTAIVDKKNSRNLILTLNDLSEDASELLEKFKDRFNIQTLSLDDVYKFADENLLLSDTYEYKDIESLEKKISRNRKEIFKNIFINKKLIIYVIAAVLFYTVHKTIFQNELGVYIAYYFIILACINAVYRIYTSYTRQKESKRQTN